MGSPPRIIELTGERAPVERLVERSVEIVEEESEALEGVRSRLSHQKALLIWLTQLWKQQFDYGRATTASRNVSGLLHPAIALVPVQLVKGLELDGTVVIEPSTILEEEPQGLRALFVALTRSTKRLVVVHARSLPKVLWD